MPQIRFTVSKEAAAYLRWYAKTILLADTEHDAAKHLMSHRLERVRRKHRRDDPALTKLGEAVDDQKK
jgi:hypothetical protein